MCESLTRSFELVGLGKDRLASARVPRLPSLSYSLADTYKGAAMWSTVPLYGVTVPYDCPVSMQPYILSLAERSYRSFFLNVLTGMTYTIRRKMNVHPGEVYNVLTLCRCSPLNSSNHAYTLLCSLSCYAVVSREPKPYDQASKSPNTSLTTYSSYCTKIIPSLCVYESIRTVRHDRH